MIVTVSVSSIELSPGSTVTIPNLSWQEFELLLKELGENRTNRIAYYNGTLEIMSPLVLHERPNRIITDIVKAILDSQGRDWEDFGSTTFTRPEVAGVEPDTCLYVQNALSVRGCTHMEMYVYPPPDLAVESDLTSVTTVSAYTALGVPEVHVWKLLTGLTGLILLPIKVVDQQLVLAIDPEFWSADGLIVFCPRT